MYETHVNLIGRVGTDVKFIQNGQGTPLATFRVVSTSRRYDRVQGTWVDGNSLWATVVCWRGLAQHVSSSLRKGDPVVVYGSLRTRAWRKENRSGQDIEIVAQTVGHDMSQGTSMFSKAPPRRDAVAASTEQVLARLAESLREETEGELDDVEGSPSVTSDPPFPAGDADVRGVGVPVRAAGALPSRPVEEEPDTRPGVSSAPTDAGGQAA